MQRVSARRDEVKRSVNRTFPKKRLISPLMAGAMTSTALPSEQPQVTQAFHVTG